MMATEQIVPKYGMPEFSIDQYNVVPANASPKHRRRPYPIDRDSNSDTGHSKGRLDHPSVPSFLPDPVFSESDVSQSSSKGLPANDEICDLSKSSESQEASEYHTGAEEHTSDTRAGEYESLEEDLQQERSGGAYTEYAYATGGDPVAQR